MAKGIEIITYKKIPKNTDLKYLLNSNGMDQSNPIGFTNNVKKYKIPPHILFFPLRIT